MKFCANLDELIFVEFVRKCLMKSLFKIYRTALVVLCLGVTLGANGAPNPVLSSCEELKDEATVTQAEFCKAHLGCRLVYGIQGSCTRAKQFLGNLKERLDQRVKSLFSRDGEVDSNAVIDASLSATARQAEQSDKAWQAKADEIRRSVSKAGKEVAVGTDGDGREWAYIGDLRGNKPDGWGAKFYSNGTIERGEYKAGIQVGSLDTYNDKLGERQTGNGQGTVLTGSGFQSYADGSYYSGDLLNGRREGRGTYTFADRSKVVGGWANDNRFGASTTYRPDGTTAEKGLFDRGGSMTIGQVFDSTGAVTKDVNTVRDGLQNAEKIGIEIYLRQQRELAARKAEAERQAQLRREEERRQAAEAAREAARPDDPKTSGRGARSF